MDNNRTSTVPIVPKQYRLPFFMLVSCFALWGLLNNMTDNLVPAFSKIFMINASESAGVQISFYGAYAVLAIFASILLEEFSYKAGVLIGLGLYMIGALCYIPAAIGQSFDIYLMAIFVLAGGLSILETTCNPFVLSMGSQETSVRRLNFAQAFNPIGSLTGIFLAKYFILAHLNDADMDTRKAMDPEQLNAIVSDELFWVCVPYVGLVAIAAVIWFFFCRYKSDDENVPTRENTQPLSSKLGRLGLCIALILIPFLFQYYSAFEFSMVQQILIMMIGPIAFLLIMPDYRCQLMKLVKLPRYFCGVAAQFFYVGVQIAVWTWTIKYIMSVFPGMQGGPLMHIIAAKAACFGEALKPEFKDYAAQVVKNAKAMAAKMAELGFRVVSNGTDNHVFMVDLRNKGINGADAQEALDRVGITVNKNAIPFDTGSPMKPSGIRIGTPAVTTRGMKEKDVEQVAEFIARALALYVGDQVCPNPDGFSQLKEEVSAFNRNFRLPH